MSTLIQFPSPEAESANLAVLRREWFGKFGEARFAHTIYQEWLAQLLELDTALREGKVERDFLYEYVLTAYEAQAQIEPGALGLEIVTRRGGGFAMPRWSSAGIKVVRTDAPQTVVAK